METKNKTTITKDMVNKKLIVNRAFDASVDQVWQAWTDSEKLELWFAPKPWKAKTKSMNFREGGSWIYAMVGPDGTEHWGKIEYKTIVPGKSFIGIDAFCDSEGNISKELPAMEWKCEFKSSDTGTHVRVEITFASEADILKIVEMGFEEGFTAAHGNLDEVLMG